MRGFVVEPVWDVREEKWEREGREGSANKPAGGKGFLRKVVQNLLDDLYREGVHC